MRLRPLLATTLALGAVAVSFAGCGISAESNGDSVRGDGGGAGAGLGSGMGGGGRAGAAGSLAGGKAGAAGTASGGKGGSPTGKACTNDAACTDGNSCTSDACLSGFCTNTPLLPGSECDDDADRCNGYGSCDGKVCKPKPNTAPNMDDGDLCTDPVCDPKTGNVVHVAKVKATDDTKCTKTTCNKQTGEKIVTPVVEDDNDACTIDECDLAAGTIHTPVAIGDKDPCTVDSCDRVTGVKHVKDPLCVGCTTKDPNADAPECDDGDPCTYERCVNSACEINLRSDGFEIDDDKNKCNGVDTCDAQGKRRKGKPLDVSDNDACTRDLCDPSGKITHPPIDFDDKNQCTIDRCDPITGAQYDPVNADDDNECTTNDRCDPSDPKNNGLKSDKIDGCTPCKQTVDCKDLRTICQVYTCNGGVCTAGNAPSDPDCSSQGDVCKSFACGGGQCNRTNLTGKDCDDDANKCNGTAKCDANGTCVKAPAVIVDDNLGCTTGSCNPATGNVIQTPKGGTCQACMQETSCMSPPAPAVLECVTPACGTGEQGECSYPIKTGPCGTVPAPSTCLLQGSCKPDGSCGAPVTNDACCNASKLCVQPADKCITATCSNNTCSNGPRKTCDPPKCGADGRSLITPSCDGTNGNCKDGAAAACGGNQVCGTSGGAASCGACTRGTDGKDPRCASGFCTFGGPAAVCCLVKPPDCGPSDNCETNLAGCPSCGCAGAMTCDAASKRCK